MLPQKNFQKYRHSEITSEAMFGPKMLLESSGGFRVARLPGQATRAAHTVGLWVEKNPIPPPNRRALDCLLSLLLEDSAPSSRKTIYSGKQ